MGVLIIFVAGVQGEIRLLCVAVLLLGFDVGVANAELPPVRIWGELGYDLRAESFEEGTDLVEHTGRLRFDAASYLYEPWFATIETGVTFNARRNDRSGDKGSGRDVNGDIYVRLLPQSRFPLEAFAERTDNSSDTDLTGLDLERTRYGVQQRYTSTSGSAYRLRYEHTDLRNTHESGVSSQRDVRDDTGDLLEGAFRSVYDDHDVSFDATYNRIDTADSPMRNETLFSTLRHGYNPGAALSANDLVTYNRTRIRQENSDFTNTLLQLTSYGFWRPDREGPLRLNATMRALTRTSESQDSESTAHAATGTLGATYELDERWFLSSSAGLTGIKNDETEISSFQTAAANFSSYPFSLGNFDASWFGQADVRNESDDESEVQGFGGVLGYTVNRQWRPTRTGYINADLRQSLAQRIDTEDFSATTLVSTASLAWNVRSAVRAGLIRLAFSDSRTVPQGRDVRQVENEFQMVNAQLSLNQELTVDSQFVVNLTVQVTREDMPRFRGMDNATNGEWLPTTMADATFYSRSLLGVPRLSFRSTLRFVSDSYLPVFDRARTLEGRDNRHWENRFEYYIGRVQLRLTGRLSSVRDQDQALLLFQIRRMFGDV